MNDNSRNTLIVCATVMFLAVIAGISAVFHYASDSGTALNFAAVMVGLLASTIAALAALLKVDKVDSKTDQLLNGAMDAKLSAAVRRELTALLAEHLDDSQKKP